MQDGFSYCHTNPIFLGQRLDLLAQHYHDGGLRQPEQAILSHCCSTPSLEAPKSRERSLTCHRNRLMSEPHLLSLFFSLSRKSDEANGSYDPVIKKRSLNRSAFHFVFVFFLYMCSLIHV
jgi:hypothetical protein